MSECEKCIYTAKVVLIEQGITKFGHDATLHYVLLYGRVAVEAGRPGHVDGALRRGVQALGAHVGGREGQLDDGQQRAPRVVAARRRHHARVLARVARAHRLHLQRALARHPHARPRRHGPATTTPLRSRPLIT